MLLLEGHTSTIYALAFSPDGRYLASGDKSGTALLWDETLQPEPLWTPGDSSDAPISTIDFSPDGESLVLGNNRKWFGFRSSDEKPFDQLFHSLRESFPQGITAARYLTPNLLAVGFGNRIKAEAGSFELWDISHDIRREPRFSSPHGVRSVAVVPPQRVAWSEWGGSQSGPRITVWDITSPDQTRWNLTHDCPSLSFHPDGGQLAAAFDRGVKVFDLTRKQERLTFKGHVGRVSAVAYNPDGRTLATASWDGTVRIWNADSGRELASYQWPIGKVFALTYSPDGYRLTAAGDQGIIAMWDVD